jgi:hypothetical protein
MSERRSMNNLLRFGLVMLGIACVASYLTTHHVLPTSDPGDLVLGLLYGLSIGAMLMGIRRSTRTCSSRSE